MHEIGLPTDEIFLCLLFVKKINDPSFQLFSRMGLKLSRIFSWHLATFKSPDLALCVASGTTEKQGRCQVCWAQC